MHAYIRFPGLQSKACSTLRVCEDSSLFWFVWFLEAGGVGRFFVALLDGIFFSGFGGGVWLAGSGVFFFVWFWFGFLGFLVCFLLFFCLFGDFLVGLPLFFNA